MDRVAKRAGIAAPISLVIACAGLAVAAHAEGSSASKASGVGETAAAEELIITPATVRAASRVELEQMAAALAGTESDPAPAGPAATTHILIRWADAAALQRLIAQQSGLASLEPDGRLDQRIAKMSTLLDQFGGRITDTNSLVPGSSVVQIDTSVGAALLAARAYGQGLVRYAEPDYILQPLATPNDTRFGEMYGLFNFGQTGGDSGSDINAAEAWDRWTGDDDFVAMVIDGGIEIDHPDLRDNIYINQGEIPGNGIDDDNNGYIDDDKGWDFWDNDNRTDQNDFHGSHTSGTVGARGNNNRGVTGVMWNCKIIPIRLLGPSGGLSSKGADAMEYAVEHNAKVSNNSYGGGQSSQTLVDAIIAAGDQVGHIFVAAAGNDGVSPAGLPAALNVPNVISVAATDDEDRLAGFSNYGAATVDIGAPGVSILSTNGGSGYSYASGTSMASPHVAGAVGLLQSFRPDWTWQEVMSHIYATGRSVPALQDPITSTGKVVDIGRAITEAATLASLRQVAPLPGLLPAGESLDLEFLVREMDDTVIAEPRLFARFGPSGSFAEVPLSSATPTPDGDSYTGSIVAGAGMCATIEFYAEFETQNRGVVTLPENGTSEPFTVPVGSMSTLADEGFESGDAGWTVGDPSDTATAGVWERGTPEQTQAQSDGAYEGSFAFVTGAEAGDFPGFFDIDGGTTTLTSAVYDVTGSVAATVSYRRWFSNATGPNPNEDTLRVEISDDAGQNWVVLETVGPTGSGVTGGWQEASFNIADFVSLTDSIRLRFIAEDSGGPSIVEAGIDALNIEALLCGAASCPADLSGDGVLNNTDINLFINAFLAGQPEADFNADGSFNNTDINLFINAFLAGC